MQGHDIMVIGASAGGIEALTEVIGPLPPDLPAAIFIVLHIPVNTISVLPHILSRYGALPAAHPKDGEAICPSRICVAPPNYHLLVKRGSIRLVRGPNENGHRPAIDPLFRAAARSYGPRVAGVVLSGTMDDGTAGLLAVKRGGGVTIVQDPDSALFSGMPRNAIEHAEVDYILPPAQIGSLLVCLAHQPIEESGGDFMPGEMDPEPDIVELNRGGLEAYKQAGTPSAFTCPECGGTLWELHDEGLARFQCRVGHAFSLDSLVWENAEQLEAALWTALRALEESHSLKHRVAERAYRHGHTSRAARFEMEAKKLRQRADFLRRVLLENGGIGSAQPAGATQESGETKGPGS